jgi:hypothetical protein
MESIADDLLDGMAAISEFIGMSPRRGFYLAEKGELYGVFKQGNRWIGQKSKIREGYVKKATQEKASAA